MTYEVIEPEKVKRGEALRFRLPLQGRDPEKLAEDSRQRMAGKGFLEHWNLAAFNPNTGEETSDPDTPTHLVMFFHSCTD